jgi:hypothetical protein
MTVDSPTNPPEAPTAKLLTTLAARGSLRKYHLTVPAEINIGDFLALANTRVERTDLLHVWVDGCEVPPGEDFQDHYTDNQLFYLTDTDTPPTEQEIGALNSTVEEEEVERPPSPTFRRVTLELKPLAGQVVSIVANAEGTVADLKNEISEKTGIAPSIRLLITVKGSDGATKIVELDNSHPLEEYGLEDGARILQAVDLDKLV